MTVRELINKLLDRPMDDEVMLCYYKEHIDKYGEKCSGYCFGIDDVKKVKSYSQIGEMKKKARTSNGRDSIKDTRKV